MHHDLVPDGQSQRSDTIPVPLVDLRPSADQELHHLLTVHHHSPVQGSLVSKGEDQSFVEILTSVVTDVC